MCIATCICSKSNELADDSIEIYTAITMETKVEIIKKLEAGENIVRTKLFVSPLAKLEEALYGHDQLFC